jgi:anti-anti-sigma factor
MHVRVSSEQSGDATIVVAEGELDLHTAPTLQAEIDSALAQNVALIVVDLSKVDFMDSTGLSVIVSHGRIDARAGRRGACGHRGGQDPEGVHPHRGSTSRSACSPASRRR